MNSGFRIVKGSAQGCKTNPRQGLAVKDGKLAFVASRHILSDPKLLVTIFEESVALKLPLGVEARRLVKDFLYLVDKGFRRSEGVVKSFERILVASGPEFNVLSVMLNTGLLGQLIPGFKGIINRIQFDAYHIFPVGRHCLRTVLTINGSARMRIPAVIRFAGIYTKNYEDVKFYCGRRCCTISARAFHPGGHSLRGAAMVKDLLAARGKAPADVEQICFLVKETPVAHENGDPSGYPG